MQSAMPHLNDGASIVINGSNIALIDMAGDEHLLSVQVCRSIVRQDTVGRVVGAPQPNRGEVRAPDRRVGSCLN
jgi:hypothetical protein